MRAGVGARTAASRGEVARRLGVSRRRVARLERRGVRALRRLDRTSSCGPATDPTPVETGDAAGTTGTFGGTLAAAGGAPVLLASTGTATGDATDSSPAGGGKTRRVSAPAQGGVESASAEQPATVLPPPHRPGSDPTPYVLLVALLAALGFGLRSLRASRS